jgi:hypothetical protein
LNLAWSLKGFTYLRQPLDILHSLILYHLWLERCRRHFGDQYSFQKVLLQAWVATVEVGMATWKAIRSHRPTRDPDTQNCIELAFRKKWLHLNILEKDDATIRWHYLPPLYFLNFSNVWWGCCFLPLSRGSLRSSTAPASKWLLFPRLPRRSLETVPIWTPGTLGTHNSRLKPRIGMRSKVNL